MLSFPNTSWGHILQRSIGPKCLNGLGPHWGRKAFFQAWLFLDYLIEKISLVTRKVRIISVTNIVVWFFFSVFLILIISHYSFYCRRPFKPSRLIPLYPRIFKGCYSPVTTFLEEGRDCRASYMKTVFLGTNTREGDGHSSPMSTL